MQENYMNEDYNNSNLGRCRGSIYIIEEGDTLYKLSKRYDVKLSDITRLNPYVNVYNLQIGEEICMPTVIDSEDKDNDIEGVTYKEYIAKEDTTIEDVMKYFGIDFEDLIKYNGIIKNITIPAGTKVIYPISRDDR